MLQRRFLIASSLARLIRNEHGTASRIVEGHFPAHSGRVHFVSIETDGCLLVLGGDRDGEGAEECTKVPRSQAEALMAVCAGKVGFECTGLRLQGGKRALLQRFVAPGALDLVSVEFGEGEDPDGFHPPSWLGPEVTEDAAYDRGSLARLGIPEVPEIPLSNTSLGECLDALEEGALATQLGRMSGQQVPDPGPVSEPAGFGPDQAPAPAVESPRTDDLPKVRALTAGDLQAPSSTPDRTPAFAPAAIQVDKRRVGEPVTFGLPARKQR